MEKMNFHTLKRKRLQALCKKHGIPANLKNIEMADRLSLIFKGKEKSDHAGTAKDGTFKGVSGKDMLNVIILDSDSSNDTNNNHMVDSDIVARGEKSVSSVKVSPSRDLEKKSSDIERFLSETNPTQEIITKNGYSEEKVDDSTQEYFHAAPDVVVMDYVDHVLVSSKESSTHLVEGEAEKLGDNADVFCGTGGAVPEAEKQDNDAYSLYGPNRNDLNLLLVSPGEFGTTDQFLSTHTQDTWKENYGSCSDNAGTAKGGTLHCDSGKGIVNGVVLDLDSRNDNNNIQMVDSDIVAGNINALEERSVASKKSTEIERLECEMNLSPEIVNENRVSKEQIVDSNDLNLFQISPEGFGHPFVEEEAHRSDDKLSLIFKGKEDSGSCQLGSENAGTAKDGTFHGVMLGVEGLDSDSSNDTNDFQMVESDVVAADVDSLEEKSVASKKISASPGLEQKSSVIERLACEMNLSPGIVIEHGLRKQKIVDSNDLNLLEVSPEEFGHSSVEGEAQKTDDSITNERSETNSTCFHASIGAEDTDKKANVTAEMISLSPEERIKRLESKVNLSPENSKDLGFFSEEENLQSSANKEQCYDINKLHPAASSVASEEFGDCLMEEVVEKLYAKTDVHEDVSGTRKVAAEAEKQDLTNNPQESNLNHGNLLLVSPEKISGPLVEEVHTLDDNICVHVAVYNDKINISEAVPMCLDASIDSKDNVTVEEILNQPHSSSFEDSEGSPPVRFLRTYQLNDVKTDDLDIQKLVIPGTGIRNADTCETKFVSSQNSASEKMISFSPKQIKMDDVWGTGEGGDKAGHPFIEGEAHKSEDRLSLIFKGKEDSGSCQLGSENAGTAKDGTLHGISDTDMLEVEALESDSSNANDNIQMVASDIVAGDVDSLREKFVASKKTSASPGLEQKSTEIERLACEMNLSPEINIENGLIKKQIVDTSDLNLLQVSPEEFGNPAVEGEANLSGDRLSLIFKGKENSGSCQLGSENAGTATFHGASGTDMLNVEALDSDSSNDTDNIQKVASGIVAGDVDLLEEKSVASKMISASPGLEQKSSAIERLSCEMNLSPEIVIEIGLRKEQSVDSNDLNLLEVSPEEFVLSSVEGEAQKNDGSIRNETDSTCFDTSIGAKDTDKKANVTAEMISLNPEERIGSSLNLLENSQIKRLEPKLNLSSENRKDLEFFYEEENFQTCAIKQQGEEDLKELHLAAPSVASEEFGDCLMKEIVETLDDITEIHEDVCGTVNVAAKSEKKDLTNKTHGSNINHGNLLLVSQEKSSGSLVEEGELHNLDDNICFHGTVYDDEHNIADAVKMSLEESIGTKDTDIQNMVVPGNSGSEVDILRLLDSTIAAMDTDEKTNVTTEHFPDVVHSSSIEYSDGRTNHAIKESTRCGTTHAQGEVISNDPNIHQMVNLECFLNLEASATEGIECETQFDLSTLGDVDGACNMEESMQSHKMEKESGQKMFECNYDVHVDTGATGAEEEESEPYMPSRKRKRGDLDSLEQYSLNELQPSGNASGQISNEKSDVFVPPISLPDTASGDEVIYQEKLESPPKVTPTASSKERTLFSPKLHESSMMNKENINIDKKEQGGTITSRNKFLKRQPLQDLQQN